MTDSPNSRGGSFLAALRGKCPTCGQGALFRSYLKVAESCAACGQNFKAAETGDGPVVFVILIAGFVACGGLLTTFLTYPDWPPTTHLLIWLPVAVIVSLVLMPLLKALMIASQLKNKVKD